jgi:probable rRNA maturation factor
MTRPGARPSEATAARRAGPAVALQLSLQFADTTDRALVTRPSVQRWLHAALERPAEITVRVVDAAEGQALNREFRGKDYATNVLTFDYAREPVVVADLVLCGPVVRREADDQGIALLAHYAHLIVHGALHAQGYDHESDAEATVMERRESDLLRRLGFDDPYAR